MKAVMEGGMEQLWKVIWSSYRSSYERWYGAAMEGDMEQL